MLMSPNLGESAVLGCHCPGNTALHEVLARSWVGIYVPLALSICLNISLYNPPVISVGRDDKLLLLEISLS